MALPMRAQPGSQRERRTSVPVPRSPLSVVPHSRRAAGFALTLAVLMAAVMAGALLLHTRISERQLEIDRLERAVHASQEEFDVLRSHRAELRSPTALADQAIALGMGPGEVSEFVSVDPMLLAITIARTGELPTAELGDGFTGTIEPLDQFRLVKSLSAEAP